AAGVLRAQLREPLRALAHDGRYRREALRVVYGRRSAVQAEVGRKRRFEPRLAGLALEGIQQRRLLAADVGAGAHERVDVEIHSGAEDVLAEQPRVVGFLQRRLEPRHRPAEEFATDVVVGDRAVGPVSADGQALDQGVRIEAQDVAIMTGARLALVRIANQILLHRGVARHEAPLRAGWEGSAAAPAQPRGLDG